MPELNRSIVLSDERIYLPAAFNPQLTDRECELLYPIGENLKEAPEEVLLSAFLYFLNSIQRMHKHCTKPPVPRKHF